MIEKEISKRYQKIEKKIVFFYNKWYCKNSDLVKNKLRNCKKISLKNSIRDIFVGGRQ